MSRKEAIQHTSYWRSVDFAAIEAEPNAGSQVLVNAKNGSKQTNIRYIIKQVGTETQPDGSFHSHEWEQCFYILSGTMMFQVKGDEPCKLMPGDFTVIPAGTEHRNSNVDGVEDCIHLSINTPMFT